MSGCAFLFPGQGSQYVGMGRDLVEHFPPCREMLTRAEAHLGLPMEEIIFFGPEERLHEDFTAQAAVYTVSCMIADLLEARHIRAGGFAPYSSGIYAAVYAAGVVDFETGLTLMQEADRCIRKENNQGAMGVVLGLSAPEAEQLCGKVPGAVEVSIVNTRHQIIVSGERPAVDSFLELSLEAGALKADRLPAGAAYHCSLLQGADQCLARRFPEIPMSDPRAPIISYIDAQAMESASQVEALLCIQLESRVGWVGVVEELIRRKLLPMVEVGPGQVLDRSVRWINRQARVLPTETAAALGDAAESLGYSR